MIAAGGGNSDHGKGDKSSCTEVEREIVARTKTKAREEMDNEANEKARDPHKEK